jgi:ABC-type branched-subunit amino acid transport system substrate-binding protein
MRKGTTTVLALAVAGCLTVTACSSSSRNAGGPAVTKNQTQAAGTPIKLGVLTSVTGVAASSFTTVEKGVKARLAVENANGGVNGHQLQYVMADDQSTGPGAVAAAQKLIQQDRVYGILENSAFFSAAAATTTKAGVPVTGVSFDAGPEWTDKSATNIFDAYGYGSFPVAMTTFGNYFKSVGATKVGAIGYGSSPSSAMAAREAVASATAVGLKAGYLDNSLAFGSTDVGPIVQKIKASGTDALLVPVVQSTAYALAKGLKQAGVKMKSITLSTGYGQDVIDDPATRQASTGVDFATIFAPVETGKPGAVALQSALAKYAGVTGVPSYGEYIGWMTADLFITGLKLAGANASSQDFISKLRAGTWDGAGLMTPTTFSEIKPTAGGLDQGGCIYIVRFDGQKFVPQPGASPECGKVVEGVAIKNG